MKLKYPDFEISKGYLAEVIRDNNITRKRTTRRHYPNKRYNKPINLKLTRQVYMQKWHLITLVVI